MENLKDLSPEKKKKIAYIEGREDLWETKILSLESTSSQEAGEDKKEILVVSRDPGSANALVPVLEILHKDTNIGMKVVADGRAQEILQKKFTTTDITPKGMVLEADVVVGKPDVLLINSSPNELGLETYAASTFNEVPVVLLEDYYGSSKGYLKRLKDAGTRFPDKICVMDEGAKKILLVDFPEIVDKIEITGQPAFDQFAKENTEEISNKVREQLGISKDECLLTFMSSLEGVAFVKVLAQSLENDADKFTFVFRRHPRDNTSYEEYEKIFNDVGIRLLNTNAIDTNGVGAASDIIMVSTSTESLNAIYRRKPNINIVDKKLDEFLPRAMPPTVELGVSAGILDVTDVSKILPELLDKQSNLRASLKENMERYYPLDGKNAERVANVVRKVLEAK